ncbi:GntR family transcriptional regulator [uncultured Jannaschia sp.]|uniref:GntR family transcriptional regulator n=1 Tax=uncultured Jannaschia sp. TaxID=293347 RepID=UPI002612EAAC|nr:GntR family transcriptional regulator [uncultured Jannaschia sp.]
MNDAGPIVRASLHDELAVRLRSMIVEDRLEPGERINERDLCELFGVSRTPLREAIKVLAREGYVTLTPNRGACVAVLTETDLSDAFPIMAALEALAGELAARAASDAQIAAILSDHVRMRTAFENRDISAYFRLNEAIHLGIASASGNPTLELMQRSLDGRVRRGRFQANVSAHRWNQAMAEHEEIAEALSERDAPRLSEVLRRHLNNKLEALRERMAETGDALPDP